MRTYSGWDSSFSDIVSRNGNSTILISDERISGRLFGQSYIEDFYNRMSLIKNIFDQPKIIMGVRKQDDMVKSIYKQYLHQGGFKEFDYIFNLKNDGIIRLKDLKYKPRIEYLKNNFNDVFIYKLENIKNDFTHFTTSLGEFIYDNKYQKRNIQFKKGKSNQGVKKNIQIKLLKKLNKINYLVSKNTFLPSVYDSYIIELFKKIGINLTPRNFCQNYLKNFGKSKFEIPNEIKYYLNRYFFDDWNYVNKNCSL